MLYLHTVRDLENWTAFLPFIRYGAIWWHILNRALPASSTRVLTSGTRSHYGNLWFSGSRFRSAIGRRRRGTILNVAAAGGNEYREETLEALASVEWKWFHLVAKRVSPLMWCERFFRWVYVSSEENRHRCWSDSSRTSWELWGGKFCSGKLSSIVVGGEDIRKWVLG